MELKRSTSGRSIPSLAQPPALNAEAEGALTASPESATNVSGETPTTSSPEEVKSAAATEDLPTPPDTPGPDVEAAIAADSVNPQDHEDSSAAAEPALGLAAQENAAEPTLANVRTISYHDDADVNIKVLEKSGTEVIYSVCSSVLQTASPVWKQVVASEARTSLNMTSDPCFGLGLLLSIAHYRFRNVPRVVDVAELYDIASTAEKYQAKNLLVPFVKSWLTETDFLAASTTSAKSAEQVLVAGGILGQIEWLTQLVSHCACNASLGADGTLLDSEGQPWSARPIASEIIDLIADVRLAAIAQIIKVVSDPVSKLLSPQSYPEEQISYCQAQSADESVREECEQLQLGSAIMGLTKVGLWPAPDPSRVKSSPVDLARSYAAVKMRRYLTPGFRFQENVDAEDPHGKCGFGHQVEIDKVLSSRTKLTAGIIEKLESHAKELGL